MEEQAGRHGTIAPLRYTCADKKNFKKYFLKPPKKRGRPKKKKLQGRGRKKVKLLQQRRKLQKHFVKKEKSLAEAKVAEAKAQLEGIIAAAKREGKAKRTNWDISPNKQLREKLARSWLEKKDLYEHGDSFQRFCNRNAINRHVLSRYLQNQAAGIQPKKRGRPTLLAHDVMMHLCEGE